MATKTTQEEAEYKVRSRCELKGYTLTEKFVYNGGDNNYIHLKCNADNHVWVATYHNFINKKSGCWLCKINSQKNDPTTAYSKVANKCSNKNYTIKEPFIYTSNSSKLLLQCNIDSYTWRVSYANFINNDTNCPKCGKRPIITQEEAYKLVDIACKNNNISLQSPFVYKNIHTKIHIRCNNDGYTWHVKYKSLINNQVGCRQCINSIIPSQEEATNKVENKCNKLDYAFEPFKYTTNKGKIYLTCNKHGYKWITSYANFVNTDTHGCKVCNESKGEHKIKTYLDQNSIVYEREKSFENCKYKKKLRFDFFLPEYSICIEFDGKQHYEPVKWFGGDKAKHVTSIRDDIKTEFCKNNSIKLVRIRYDENVESILKNLKL